MSDWLSVPYNGIALLTGIVITHSLFLFTQFYGEAEGYMWRAARKLWHFLLMFFAVEWVIGAVICIQAFTDASPRVWLWSGFIGIIIAAIPTALESILLPKTGATVKTVERRITRLLVKLRVMLRYNFARAVETSREQDVYDCQQPEGWGLGLTPEQIRRNLRMLYEFYKYKIAEDRGDTTFLHYDVNRTPWDQFYLLVRHVGRKKLRDYIKRPISTHCPNWDGRERRRVNGERAARNLSDDPDPSRGRRYDDKDLIRSIKKARKHSVPKLPGRTGNSAEDEEDD